MTLYAIKQQLRSGKYAWPGGYPTFFICSDSAALCHDCVRKHWRSVCEAHLIDQYRYSGWHVEACDVNWEDPDLLCDNCSTRIESAYAEPEDTDNEIQA